MSTHDPTRCPADGYKYVAGVCPVCRYEQPTVKPELPEEVRRIPVHRLMFITAQHHAAWVSSTPLPRHIPGRKKIDRVLREIVYREKGRRCEECGRTDYLTVDHVVPVALGGATNSTNARVLCEPCNRAAWLRFAPYMRAVRAYLKVAA